MLTISNYVNGSATVAAYGDATSTVYGRYALHQNAMYALYQCCGAKGTDASGNAVSGAVGVTSPSSGAGSSVPTGLIVLIVLAVVSVAAVVIVVVITKNIKRVRGRQ